MGALSTCLGPERDGQGLWGRSLETHPVTGYRLLITSGKAIRTGCVRHAHSHTH